MARIRPAKGQDRSGDGAAPPGGARPPRGGGGGGGGGGRRPRTPAPRPTPPQPPGRRKPDKAGTVTKAVQRERRGSRFIKEMMAELRKVSWPTRVQLVQSTAVVLAVVVIVTLYLAGVDAIFRRLVDSIF